MKAVLWILASLGAAGTLAAQDPGSSTPARDPRTQALVMTRTRHAVFLRRAIVEVEEALRRAPPAPGGERLLSRLQAAVKLDRQLSLQEQILSSSISAPSGPLAKLIDFRRQKLKGLVEGLAAAGGPRLQEPGAFEPPPPVSLPAGPPETTLQLRLHLRTTPVSSVEEMFGLTSRIPAAKLPRQTR